MPPREGIAEAMPNNARVLALKRHDLNRQQRISRAEEVFPTRSMPAFESRRTKPSTAYGSERSGYPAFAAAYPRPVPANNAIKPKWKT
jgi:hypothetical protein